MLLKNSTIDSARDTADYLYQLMDLMVGNFGDMNKEQARALNCLRLELSGQISSWLDAEEERRNG